MLKAKNIFYAIGALLAPAFLTAACDDSDNIGNSLVADATEIVIADEFQISGHSVDNNSVQSRTTTLVLGRFKAEGYGNFASEFVTQFMPATALPTSGITAANIDSLKLQFAIPKGSFVGDSLVPMGLEVYTLNKQLPSPIYSDFDPAQYYSPSDRIASKMYVCNTIGATDSIKKLGYNLVDVKLPLELGRNLYQLYVDHPEAYSFPGDFARYFPGIYVRSSFGSGRVVAIQSTTMRLYWHTTGQDSDGKETIVRQEGAYYAVTPEIVMNNSIDYSIDATLQQSIDAGEQVVVAPVGRDVEFEFPVKSVIDYYNTNAGSLSVINTLTLDIPATAVENSYGIEPPTNLLMVLKSKKNEFFNKNLLNDDVTSFYATYDSANHRYRFTGLRNYLLDAIAKTELKSEDYTFVLTPVNLITEQNSSSSYYYGSSSTTYVSAINPYIGQPCMARLDLAKSKLTLTFSKQTAN